MVQYFTCMSFSVLNSNCSVAQTLDADACLPSNEFHLTSWASRFWFWNGNHMINFCNVKLSKHFIQTATIKKHLGQKKHELKLRNTCRRSLTQQLVSLSSRVVAKYATRSRPKQGWRSDKNVTLRRSQPELYNVKVTTVCLCLYCR